MHESTVPRTPVFIYFLSGIVFFIGFSMLRPVVALYLANMGNTGFEIGLLITSNAILPMILAMPVGQWIDGMGTRKTVMMGMLLMMCGGMLFTWASWSGMFIPLLLAQMIHGVGNLLGWGAISSAIARRAMRNTVVKGDQLLSNFAFVNAIAQFTGPALAGILSDQMGYINVFLISGVFFPMLSILCAIWLPKNRRNPSQERIEGESESDTSDMATFWSGYRSGLKMLKSNKSFQWVILLNASVFIIVDLYGTFLPIHLSLIGYSNTQVGVLLSIGGMASIFIRPFVGKLVRTLGIYGVCIACLTIGGSCLLASMWHPTWLWIAVIIFIWGCCIGLNQPMTLIMVARTVLARQQGMGMSIRTMAARLIQVVNPMLFGIMSGIIGFSISFGVYGVFLLGLSGWTYGKLRPLNRTMDRDQDPM